MPHDDRIDFSRRNLGTLLGALGGAAGLAALLGCSSDGDARADEQPDGVRKMTAAALQGSAFLWFDTVLGAANSLRSVSGSDQGAGSSPVAVVGGYASPNDGGGGVFYWSNAPVTDDGGTVIVPVVGGGGAPGAAGPCWRRIYTGALDVRWFGAHADGTDAADTYAAVTRALTAAASPTASRAVYFPAGTYSLDNTISVPASVTLRGEGIASVLNFNVIDIGIEIAAPDVTLDRLTVTGAPASRVVAIAGPPAPADGGAPTPLDGVTVRSCTISGGTLDGTSGEPAGIWLFNVSNVRLEDNILSGNGDGNATYAHGADIFFSSSGGPAPSSGAHVRGNSCTSHAAPFGIALFNVVDSEVSGNTVANMALTSAEVGGYGILVSSTATTWVSDRITISDNAISNTAGSGIYLKLVGTATVRGNTVSNTCLSQSDASLNVAGIAVGSGAVAIVGNVVRTSNKAGISFGSTVSTSSTGMLVEGNYCTGCVSGIAIRGAVGFVVQGNTLVGCSYAGIRGSGDATFDSGTISGNYVSGAGQYGIIFETASAGKLVRCAINGNVVIGAGYSGITLFQSLPSAPTNFDNIVAGNVVLDCGVAAAGITTGIGIDARGLARSIISGNRCGNSIGGAMNQSYGIAEGGMSAAQLANSVLANNVSGNAAGGLLLGAETFHRDNVTTASIGAAPTSQMNGRVNLTGTTPVVIENPEALLGDSILVTRQTVSGTAGHLSASVVAGAPNTIQIVSTCSETSSVYWEIVH